MSAPKPPPPPPEPPKQGAPVRAMRKGGNTANRSRWKPGQAGNPRGINQHSSVPTFRQLMEEELNRFVPNSDTAPKYETNKAALVRQAVTQARKGNLTALMWLVERVEGKVPDHVVQDVRNAIVMVPWNDEEADVEYVPRATTDHVLPLPGEPPLRRRDSTLIAGPPDEQIREAFDAELQAEQKAEQAEDSQGHTSEG
jgi:hypothetical protein